MAVTTGTMMAIGAAVSIAGTLAQGQAQKKAAQAEAAQAELIASQQQEAAADEAARIRKAGEKTKGAARAQMAANGIRVDEGTALRIDEEIERDSEMDAMNTLLTGQRRAQASQFAASQARARGSNAQTASVLGAVSTGLNAWKGVGGGMGG